MLAGREVGSPGMTVFTCSLPQRLLRFFLGGSELPPERGKEKDREGGGEGREGGMGKKRGDMNRNLRLHTAPFLET